MRPAAPALQPAVPAAMQRFVDGFAAAACLERSAPPVAEARAAALARAVARGLPERRDERWRYTDLRRLGAAAKDAAPLALAALPGARLRVDRSDRLPPGLSLRRIAAGDADAAALLDLEQPGVDAFVDLNGALADGGLLIEVAPGAQVELPLELVHLGAAGDLHPRLKLKLGAGARLSVLERVARGGGLSNAVARVELADRAALEWMRLSEGAPTLRSIGWLDATLGADARLTLHSQLGASELDRFAARIRLAGRGARADVYALSVVDGRARADQMLAIEHLAPDTVSRQTYRGIAGGRAAAAATCRALIEAGATGSDAQQSLGSLPLSASAECDARPELEIHCDDVACRHGATVGALDEQALFYLRSRGLDPAEARALLVFAFADAALAALPRDAFRAALEARLAARLPREADAAAGGRA